MTRGEAIIEWTRGPAVLDVGCAGHVPEPGSSHWVHGCLQERFKILIGIDINEKNVGRLKQLGYKNIYVASAEEFKLSQKFDSIVAGELIEHLSNPGSFFLRCHEHLQPHGRIILTTPYPFSLLYVLYAILKFPKTCQNMEHVFWFCPQTFKEFAKRNGFKIVHWDLIEDYRLDDPSPRYRLFARFITSIIGRCIIPKRFRCNTMLFILETK